MVRPCERYRACLSAPVHPGFVTCRSPADVSPNGRYVIVFNGEIYNSPSCAESSSQRRAPTWRGHSDTEVLLAIISRNGALSARWNGDWNVCVRVVGSSERVLHLARDRIGEKPLYYGWIGSTFIFGSELKALRAHPHWNAEIDRVRWRSSCATTTSPRRNRYTAEYPSYCPLRSRFDGSRASRSLSRTGLRARSPNAALPIRARRKRGRTSTELEELLLDASGSKWLRMFRWAHFYLVASIVRSSLR